MPIGYLVSVALVAWCTLFALTPPRPRQSSPSNLSYRFDLFHSLRFEAVVDAIEAFSAWVRCATAEKT